MKIKTFSGVIFWGLYMLVFSSLFYALAKRYGRDEQITHQTLETALNNRVLDTFYVNEDCTWQSLCDMLAASKMPCSCCKNVGYFDLCNQTNGESVRIAGNQQKYARISRDKEKRENKRIFVYFSESGIYCQKASLDDKYNLINPDTDILCFSVREMEEFLAYLNSESNIIVALSASKDFNLFYYWNILHGLFHGIDYERIETWNGSLLLTPNATEKGVPPMFRKEIICSLFHVGIEDVAEAVWMVKSIEPVVDKMFLEEAPPPERFCIEGAFRTENAELLPMNGLVVYPSGYEQYAKTQIDDWKSNEDFTHKILRKPHTGEVFFSPETNWIYFKLELK